MSDYDSIEALDELSTELSFAEIIGVSSKGLDPVRRVFADYHCATMEVETKFRILDNQLSLNRDRNPIEYIRSRVKTPESILRKMERKGCPLTVASMMENVRDIAGVRVICSFEKDIYDLADLFLSQDGIELVQRKDYFANPKQNGYRSLHLIVRVPISKGQERIMVLTEVQLRTIAMDFWASLEYKIRYKKDLSPEQLEELNKELTACARLTAKLDRKMEELQTML